MAITVIRTTTTTTATTIPTMAMAAATWCSGACIPGLAGVSDLSRCAADPAVFDGWKEMIWPGELKLRTGAEDSHGLGVFCTEAAKLPVCTENHISVDDVM